MTPPRPPRILRALLRLFPAEHRERYGEEMWEVVEYRFRSAARRGGGPVARLRLVASTAADLAGSALRLHAERAADPLRSAARGLGLDARFVARSLRRSPGYAVTAVAVLAAAVAVSATVFSFVHGTLLHRPPWPEPDRVVAVWGSNPGSGQLRDVISGPTYLDLDREARALEPLAAFHHDATYLTGGETPEVIDALEVTADFLDVLGVEPVLGRGFSEAERTSAAAPTALVSWRFWQDRMGGDPGAVGSSLSLEGRPHTVIGVLPRDFRFLAPAAVVTPLYDDLLEADGRYRIHYNAVGRLAPGATPGEASRELTAIMETVAREHTGFEGWTVRAEPLHRVSVEAVRPALWTLAVLVAVVLGVALVNLATLFRIRTVTRERELAVRMALGSGWTRLARVLGLEAGVLAGAGALLGLVLAPFLLDRVTALVPPWIPIPGSAAMTPSLQALLDPAVAGLTAGAALAGALALTVPGYVRALRRGGSARGAGGAGSLGGTRLLVGVELALATVLCLGAFLSARSAAHLLAVETGVEDRGLLTLYLGDVWDRDREAQVRYFREAVEAVEALPGVRSAAVIDYVDFTAEDDYARVDILDRESRPATTVREEWRRVSHGLFETAGMAIRAGRTLEADDFRGPPRVAVVNEAFARAHLPDGALGRFVGTHEAAYDELEVVGVVADVRSLGPAEPPPPMLYVPNQGSPRGTQGMYVRVSGDPMAYGDRVRAALASVDPSQPVARIQPMTALVSSWVAIPRATRALVSGLAVLALVLSAVGIFGVVGYLVRARRQELGVRLALGASPGRLEGDLLRSTAPVLLLGIGAGLTAGLVAARGAGAVLHGVGALDPVSVAGTVLAMAAAGLLATWLPARRVTEIDPSEAMRPE